MALFSRVRASAAHFLTPVKHYDLKLSKEHVTGDYLMDQTIQRNIASEDSSDFGDENEETFLNTQKNSGTKRSPLTVAKSRKKRRLSDAAYEAFNSEDEDELDGITFIESSSPEAKAQRDRKAMPPPKHGRGDRDWTPNRQMIDRDLRNNIVPRNALDSEDEYFEDEIYTDKTRLRKDDRREIPSDYQFERSKRFAEATELPANSGVWTLSEKDLFYRLAMRGFEPLIPGNWSMDFTTFPQTIFDVDGGEPALIQSNARREFRAIFNLRSLVMMGMRARDRRLVDLPCEPIMRTIMNSFISWALLDSGLHPSQRPNTIPIHAVATKRHSERADNVISRVNKKLSKLAERYKAFHNIHTSVEQNDLSSDSSNYLNETTVSEDDDPRFPILTGFIILSTIIVIVTHDSHRSSSFSSFSSPSSASHRTSSTTSLINCSAKPKQRDWEAESGLRFIGSFDFSETGMDVWNALALAIVVMRIRKSMAEMCEAMTGPDATREEVEMWREVQRESGDGEDA
ncbi:MAG: hypothetical protein Q9227_008805 [Pyrenula ochraceoflavens]